MAPFLFCCLLFRSCCVKKILFQLDAFEVWIYSEVFIIIVFILMYLCLCIVPQEPDLFPVLITRTQHCCQCSGFHLICERKCALTFKILSRESNLNYTGVLKVIRRLKRRGGRQKRKSEEALPVEESHGQMQCCCL